MVHLARLPAKAQAEWLTTMGPYMRCCCATSILSELPSGILSGDNEFCSYARPAGSGLVAAEEHVDPAGDQGLARGLGDMLAVRAGDEVRIDGEGEQLNDRDADVGNS